MKGVIPESFRPNIGLSSIALDDEATGGGLPTDSRLQPIDGGLEAKLKAMLQADTFDAMILDAVRPKGFDRNVLAPARFHLLREEITGRLASIAAGQTGPAAAEMHDAIALLRKRGLEHDLGQTLRYALLKG